MATTVQQYYALLARTDHPVFNRDFSTVTTADSPFNSIMNRVMADQIKKFRDDMLAVQKNSYPYTADALSIDQWEETYFGFTKPTEDLATRVTELLIKINSRIGMDVGDVIKASQSITGLTPIIIRNLYSDGWAIDVRSLDVDSVLAGSIIGVDSFTYVVIFPVSVDSFLLKKLDDELTKIEKAGCNHVITSVPSLWTLDISKIDLDTTLR